MFFPSLAPPLVEPLDLVSLGLKRRHDDVDVVVAQPEDGLVRVDPGVRGEPVADAVQLGLVELLAAEQVV